jgi:aminopeptidase N
LKQVPMADYGKAGMTDNSYRVGALMFDTMYRLMGHKAFTQLIGTYYQRYEATGGSTDDLVRLAAGISPVSLDRVFGDWLYSTRWTEIVAGTPGHALADRYRAASRQ